MYIITVKSKKRIFEEKIRNVQNKRNFHLIAHLKIPFLMYY